MKVLTKSLLAAVIAAGFVSSAQAATVWMDQTTNDGSFEQAYGAIIPGTGNEVRNSNEHPPGAPITSAGIWSYAGFDATSNTAATGGSIGFAEFGSNLGPASSLPLFSDGTGNPDSGRGISAFADPRNRRVEFESSALAIPAGVGNGDALSWAFDLMSFENNPVLGQVDFGIDFGSGLVPLATAVNQSDNDGSIFEVVSGAYSLTASDLATGNYQVVFSITNNDPDGNGDEGRLFVDNIQISSTAIPEPASLALFSLAGLACVGLRRRQ